MSEHVDEGGLVLLDLIASALKLGCGAMLKRNFWDAREYELEV